MLLKDAIRRAELVLDKLSPEEAAAIYALVELGKRVQRLQDPLRRLSRALLPDDLTQTSLFAEGDDG
jgi:hypothetical protein